MNHVTMFVKEHETAGLHVETKLAATIMKLVLTVVTHMRPKSTIQ